MKVSRTCQQCLRSSPVSVLDWVCLSGERLNGAFRTQMKTSRSYRWRRLVIALGIVGFTFPSGCTTPSLKPPPVEEPAPLPVLADFAVYAERSVALESDVVVEGGDLGVRHGAPADFGSQLRLGHRAIALRRLLAPSVSLSYDAHAGTVETNFLVNHGGMHQAVLPFPATAMPPLPLAIGP